MIVRVLPRTPDDISIGNMSAPDVAQVLLFMVKRGYAPETALAYIWNAGAGWSKTKSSFDSETLKMFFDTAPRDDDITDWPAILLSEPQFDLSLLKPEDIDDALQVNTLIKLLKNDKVSRQVKLTILENEQARLKPRKTVLQTADSALPGYRIQSII